jgi:hypothetical protein
MPSSHSPNTINVKLASNGLRLLLLIPLTLAVLGGWFSVRWLLGSTISEAASTGETPNLDLTRVGVRWAPSDPFVHWRLGVLAQRDFSANNLEQTSRDFEEAVRLSPNDFRYWDELGRALEAAGQAEAAEKRCAAHPNLLQIIHSRAGITATCCCARENWMKRSPTCFAPPSHCDTVAAGAESAMASV